MQNIHNVANQDKQLGSISPISRWDFAKDEAQHETATKLPFDYGQTSRFLTSLDGGREGGTFCFQTLDDNKQRNDRERLARTRHGRLDDLAPNWKS
jgi:hypothetical protein